MIIEIVAAWPARTIRVAVDAPAGATLADVVAMALSQSDALAAAVRQGEQSDGDLVWGIFGQQADPSVVLQPGARVELYRPLQRDPREARRLLADRGLDVTYGDET